jgi:hypothetical protein
VAGDPSAAFQMSAHTSFTGMRFGCSPTPLPLGLRAAIAAFATVANVRRALLNCGVLRNRASSPLRPADSDRVGFPLIGGELVRLTM